KSSRHAGGESARPPSGGLFVEHTTSYWVATARNMKRREPFAGDPHAVDAVVVGAGYTGLSAAYHLQASGVSTVVLEANRVGWGGSGRNGGHVSRGFKMGLQKVAKRWGFDAARDMFQMSLD